MTASASGSARLLTMFDLQIFVLLSGITYFFNQSVERSTYTSRSWFWTWCSVLVCGQVRYRRPCRTAVACTVWRCHLVQSAVEPAAGRRVWPADRRYTTTSWWSHVPEYRCQSFRRCVPRRPRWDRARWPSVANHHRHARRRQSATAPTLASLWHLHTHIHNHYIMVDVRQWLSVLQIWLSSFNY